MSELLRGLSGTTVHMVGIGGISMSGLCEILMSMGIHVTGSDVNNSPIIENLKKKNVTIFSKQEPNNITNQKLVIYTTAMPLDHPELEAARNKGIPVIDRATFLGEIMRMYEKNIAVAGTHGKTTTTSMISSCLIQAEKDPTVHIGGIFDAIGGTTRVGASPFFITEACEYKDSFLKFYPHMGIILNIESDHLDYFRDINHIEQSFLHFATQVSHNGVVVGNADDERILNILQKLNCRTITYGLSSPKALWTAKNIIFDNNGFPSFYIVYNKKSIAKMKLSVPGLHNISNSLACVATCSALNIPVEIIIKSLKKFKGTHRRFEHKGTVDGIKVIDDYAHHPTEVVATLKAARSSTHGKILCVFQPHTYTRTKELLEDFSTAFTLADKVYVTDIYAARELDNGLVHSSMLVEKINTHSNNAVYLSSFKDIVDTLIHDSSSGDIVITMGAGNVDKVGELFLLEKKIRAVG